MWATAGMADTAALGTCADRDDPHPHGIMCHDWEPVAVRRVARVDEDEMYAFAKRVLADVEIVAGHVDHRALGRVLSADQFQAVLAGAFEARSGPDAEGVASEQAGIDFEALRQRIDESDLAGVELSGCGFLQFHGDTAAVVAGVWNAMSQLLAILGRSERADGDRRH